MPNLAGTFDMRDHPADTATTLVRLASVLDMPGVNYTVRSWRDTRFAAVNVLTGICGNLEQPAIAAGQTVLFLDGEISNLSELWDTVVHAESKGPVAHPARACLDLYGLWGNDFVTRLDGQFNILLYDQANRSVRVFSDRLAYRPFYYCCAEGLALFGLEKKALFAVLGRTPPLDPMGTLELFTFGHNLDDRTIFSGVHAMPPAAMLEFKDSRQDVRRYWRPTYANRGPTASLDESAQELGRRLTRAVTRRAGGNRRFGIFLSGGLDSRAAAGALARVRGEATSFTFGPVDSPDFRYGRQLAAELGLVHHHLRNDETSLSELLPRVVWRTEGSLPFHQALSIAHHRQIRAEADVIFTGHFGDSVSGGHLLPALFLARNVRDLAEHILAKRSMLPVSTIRALFKRPFLEDALPELVRGIERSLLALDEDRLPLAYNLWDMLVRQRRFTFCSPAVDRYTFEVVTPFTDNDVVDWMLSMPIRYLFGQRVYKRMIVQTFPEIAHVPWARTGRRISTHFAIDMTQQAVLFAGKRLHWPRGRSTPAAEARLRSLEPRVVGDLLSRAVPDDLFEGDGVRRAARAALNGSGSPTSLFLLLTLDECIRLFGTDGLIVPPREAWPPLQVPG
jgi:asparagine synthase (glutamine-hydrolysing)